MAKAFTKARWPQLELDASCSTYIDIQDDSQRPRDPFGGSRTLERLPRIDGSGIKHYVDAGRGKGGRPWTVEIAAPLNFMPEHIDPQKPNSTYSNTRDENSLSIAAGAGRKDLVQLSFRYGARLPGNAMMSAAAGNGEFEMLRFLVEEYRLDIDEMYVCRYNEPPGGSDGTALHKAAERGDISIAAYLLEKGARDPRQGIRRTERR